MKDLAAGQGFRIDNRFTEGTSRMALTAPSVPGLPEGFRLQSLAENNDLRRVNQVLWRGFNHDGPPPDDEIPGRAFAQTAPAFRKDMTIVAVAPNGDYASYSGMWVVPDLGYCYVEPVATDPTYRRMGLGRAVVLEAMSRAHRAGAELAWVGSDQEFYLSMGFEKAFETQLWWKPIDHHSA